MPSNWAYLKQWRKRHTAQGLCRSCNNKVVEGAKTCPRHMEKPGNSSYRYTAKVSYRPKRFHKITYKGKTQGILAWSRELGINKGTLATRLHHGWSVARAFTEKVRKHNP